MKNNLLTYSIGVLISIIPFSLLTGQSPKIDSLIQALDNVTGEEQKIEINLQLIDLMVDNDPERAKTYGENALMIAQKIGHTNFESHAKSSLANYYASIGDYQKSKKLIKEALQQAAPTYYPVQLGARNTLGGLFFYQGQLDSALKVYQHIYDLTQTSISNTPLAEDYRIKAVMNLGSVHRMMGDKQTALNYYKQALEDARRLNKITMYSTILENIGNNTFDLETRAEYYIEAIELDKANGNNQHLVNMYYRLGSIYIDLNQPNKIKEYWSKGYQLVQRYNFVNAQINAFIGDFSIYHIKQNELEAASEKAQYCLDLSQRIGDKANESYAISCMALIALKKGNLQESFDLSKKALELANDSKDIGTILTLSLSLAEFYIDNGAAKEAFPYIEEAINIAEHIQEPSVQMDATFLFYKAYEKLGNYDKALDYHIQYKSLQDTLTNMENKVALQEVRTKYETQQTENENKYLLQTNKLAIQQRNRLVIAVMLLLFFIVTLTTLYINIRKARQKIARQNEQLNQLNDTQNQLFAIISHDLRSEASAFQQLSQITQHHLKNNNIDRLSHIFGQVERSASNLNSLLDNLLQWAIVQLEDIQMQPKSLHLNDQIEEAITLYREHAKVKGIALENHTTSDLNIWADQNSIQLILRNLLSNAIKFTPKNGQIKITAESQSDQVKISIADTGIGIPTDKLAYLFQIDQRESTKGTAGERGSGIGLMLTKEFIERNKGELNIQSRPGKGTICEFSVPITQIS